MKPRKANCIAGLLIWLVAMVWMFTAMPCYAFYNPQTGRWLSRDPLFELGFEVNWPTGDSDDSQESAGTYAFVRNAPINFIDATGLLSIADIWGLAFNPLCGSLSVQGNIELVDWHVTGNGLVNKIACNGLRAALRLKINSAIKLPYSKTFACKKGTCHEVTTFGPLYFPFSPKVPLYIGTNLKGDFVGIGQGIGNCTVDIELSGTITASGKIGYCCGK